MFLTVSNTTQAISGLVIRRNFGRFEFCKKEESDDLTLSSSKLKAKLGSANLRVYSVRQKLPPKEIRNVLSLR